jgi:hypothetical protein
MATKRSEIDALLAHYGIKPIGTRGTGSQEAAGGQLATISVERAEEGPVITVTIGGLHATGACPLDRTGALAILETLRSGHLISGDQSLEHMVANLLVKISEMYVDSDAERIIFESVHLHPTSYYIGRVQLKLSAPLHARKRLLPDAHDRHAIFSHRHGDNTRFPK